MRTSVWILSVCLAFVGCDDDGGGDETISEVEPEPVEPEEVGGDHDHDDDDTASADGDETTGYTIHEWGLIDIDLGQSQAEYAAGPGRATHATATGSGGSSGTGSNGTGSSGTGRRDDVVDEAFDTANDMLDVLGVGGRPPTSGARRKPVLYFHLADANPDFTFELTVDLRTGNVIEHFPAGTTAEHRVTWSGVALASESCAGGPYPTEDSEICRGVSDGYCEAAELASYVASDAGCLTFGGTEHNFLFYRGDGPIPTLPLTITRAADGTVTITNDSMGETAVEMLRLRRDGDTINVSRVSVPSQGQSISLGRPADAAAESHREWVRVQLRSIGLTDPEAEAFERAWFGELFDASAETPHAFPDAVFFFLPADSVDGFAHIEATPAPSGMVRAMAVRAGWTSL